MSVIIVAAGSGTRMGMGNKLLLELDGRSVLCRSIDVFEHCRLVDEIIITAREDAISTYYNLVRAEGYQKVKTIVAGGAQRGESVLQGLLEVSPGADLVAIHDGARPLLQESVLAACIKTAAEFGAAVCGTPVKDTIKRADEGKTVLETVERQGLWAVQTPQIFRKDLLMAAYQTAAAEGVFGTDDCSVAERAGVAIRLVEGSASNLKITTPEDLILAEYFLNEE